MYRHSSFLKVFAVVLRTRCKEYQRKKKKKIKLLLDANQNRVKPMYTRKSHELVLFSQRHFRIRKGYIIYIERYINIR